MRERLLGSLNTEPEDNSVNGGGGGGQQDCHEASFIDGLGRFYA